MTDCPENQIAPEEQLKGDDSRQITHLCPLWQGLDA